jgi:hypothetical protein
MGAQPSVPVQKTSAARLREISKQYGLIPLITTSTWNRTPPEIQAEFANGITTDYKNIEPNPQFWIDIIDRFDLLQDLNPVILKFYEDNITFKESILSSKTQEQYAKEGREFLDQHPKLHSFLAGTYTGGSLLIQPTKHYLAFDSLTKWDELETYAIVEQQQFFTYLVQFKEKEIQVIDEVLVFVPSVAHLKTIIKDYNSPTFGDIVAKKVSDLPLIGTAVKARQAAVQKATTVPVVFKDPTTGKVIADNEANDKINLSDLAKTPEFHLEKQPSKTQAYLFDTALAIGISVLAKALFF